MDQNMLGQPSARWRLETRYGEGGHDGKLTQWMECAGRVRLMARDTVRHMYASETQGGGEVRFIDPTRGVGRGQRCTCGRYCRSCSLVATINLSWVPGVSAFGIGYANEAGGMVDGEDCMSEGFPRES